MRKKVIILCALFLLSSIVTAIVIAPNVIRNDEAKNESENATMKPEEKNILEPEPEPIDIKVLRFRKPKSSSLKRFRMAAIF